MAAVGSVQSVKTFIISNWFGTLTFFTRLVTVISSLFYFLGSIFGNPYAWYQRALIANAATSALRLHQRISQHESQLRFSQETVQLIIAEDSLHYLLFSIIFLMTPPVTVALAPVFLFAFLHCLGFSQTLLSLYISERNPPPEWTIKLRNLISKAQCQNDNLLRIIAVHEILLMVIAIVLAFSGRMLLLPFFYYHFLKLRYASRRNPYCRRVFSELRMSFSQLASHRYCPQLAKSIIYSAINFISRLSPTVRTA